MYPASHAALTPDRIAFVMAASGRTVTYLELEQRSNRLAHLLRDLSLQRLDHFAVFMENNAYYLECVAAGERTGLYTTCVNSWLTAQELAYIINNSESQVLITSTAKLDVALQALPMCPQLRLCLVCCNDNGAHALPSRVAGSDCPIKNYDLAVAACPVEPVADEALGTPMLYSSGTTGRPKGVLRPVPEQPPSQQLPLFEFLMGLWQYRPGMVYLSPAPLYHAAPIAAVSLAIRMGAMVVIMEHFDAEQYLALVERHQVTHSQLVPTMFSRMLKLPDEQRLAYRHDSLEVVVHAAAPCPVAVKERMIDWWGPIIHEYYGATEGLGFTACDSHEWLAHRGTVGKVLLGELHVLDERGQPSPRGTPGEIWFKTATPFEYFNDPARTAQSRSADGTMSTVGDIGYVDDDNFLYLTDRSTFMIISGGVNIYPQEAEDLLITHPKVLDAAVFGVPNEDLGEEVKAVVQVLEPGTESDELAQELIAFCRAGLAHLKCPRTIDFIDEMPRLPTGKLYKRPLRDKYWQGVERKT